jgi:hypothetical protein
MLRRTPCQQGSVQREKRRSGPDVWIFRWREIGPDGNSKLRKTNGGTVEGITTEVAALKTAHALRIEPRSSCGFIHQPANVGLPRRK